MPPNNFYIETILHSAIWRTMKTIIHEGIAELNEGI